MADIDTTWLLLNLVLLACGAIPAVMALRADRAPQASSRNAHEQPQGLSPAQFRRSAAVPERMRHPT